MNELNWFIDRLKQLETAEGYITPARLINEKLPQWLKDYDGSALDGYVIQDLTSAICKAFKDEFIEDAYAEFLLLYGDEKTDHKGVPITPTEGYYKYDYAEDTLIAKYENEMERIEKEIQPQTKQLKDLKKSIKERQKTLVAEGKATMTSKTQTLKFERK